MMESGVMRQKNDDRALEAGQVDLLPPSLLPASLRDGSTRFDPVTLIKPKYFSELVPQFRQVSPSHPGGSNSRPRADIRANLAMLSSERPTKDQ